MARDTLTIQELAGEGSQYDAAIAFTAMTAANDMDFDNVGGNILIMIVNEHVAAQTATFVSVADDRGRSGDLSIEVAAGKTAMVGPFNPTFWNQSDGKVHIDSDDETTFNFAAIRYTQR